MKIRSAPMLRWTLLVAAGFVGCSSSTMWARQDFSSRHPACARADVDVEEGKKADYWFMNARGCGADEEYILAGSCWQSVSAVVDQAAFATGCAKEEIRHEVFDPHTMAVQACGQRLVYKSIRCTWVLDSATEPPASTSSS